MKQIKLTHEERQILEKLSTKQLHFLKKIYEDAQFTTFKDIVNILIDIEKNIFFGTEGGNLAPEALSYKHAYARGGIARLTTFLRLMVGAEQEAQKREEERKKRKDEKV